MYPGLWNPEYVKEAGADIQIMLEHLHTGRPVRAITNGAKMEPELVGKLLFELDRYRKLGSLSDVASLMSYTQHEIKAEMAISPFELLKIRNQNKLPDFEEKVKEAIFIRLLQEVEAHLNELVDCDVNLDLTQNQVMVTATLTILTPPSSKTLSMNLSFDGLE